MRSSRRRRPAFRKADLVVVIACLAILLGMMLPAIEGSRVSAERTQCQNNLKQIGLGLHNYHSTYNHMPPGAICSPLYPGNTVNPVTSSAPLPAVSYATSPSIGALALLLPYVESSAVFPQIPQDLLEPKSNLPAWAYGTAPFDTNPFPDATTNRAGPNYTGIPAWSQNRIRSYECPAADLDAPFNTTPGVTVGPNGVACGVIDCFFLCAYVVLTNAQLSPVPGAETPVLNWLDYCPPTSALSRSQGIPDVAVLGLTNYVANAGTLGPCDKKTTLWSYLKRSTADFTNPAPGPGQIYRDTLNIPGAPDGPNGTMHLAQYCGPFNVNSRTRFTDIQDGTSNTVAFGETFGGRQFTDGSVDFKIAWAAGSAQGSFGGSRVRADAFRYCSNHTAVNNFLYCDGSVRPIAKIRDVTFDPPPDQWMVFQSICAIADAVQIDWSQVTGGPHK